MGIYMNFNNKNKVEIQCNTSWGRRLNFLGKLGIIIIVSLLIFGFWITAKVNGFNPFNNSWVLSDEKSRTGPVIGNLGGISVSIPTEFAHFVEYVGDPHFMDTRKGQPPIRTFESKLYSFGYEVRYPDMQGETSVTWQEKKSALPSNTNWLVVGVTYFGHLGEPINVLQIKLDEISRRKWNGRHQYGEPATNWFERYGYTLSSQEKFGLKVYEVYGYDEEERSNIQLGHDILDKNIYFNLNQKGKAETLIECSNAKHDAAPCEQRFYLPNAQFTEVKIMYRIGLLPQWRELQQAVTRQLLSFSIQPKTKNY